MNLVDFFILAVLVLGLIVGLRSGFVKQVFGFLGLVAALLAAFRFMDDVGQVAVDSLGISESIAPLVGFSLVFVGVEILVFALIRILETILGALALSPVNRVFGGLVGGLKAALALSVLFLVGNLSNLPSESARNESNFYSVVAGIVPTVWDRVTQEFPQATELPRRIGVSDEDGDE